MSSVSGSSRLTELLAKVDEALNANQAPRASSILQEASKISPQDAEVKKRWLALQRLDGGVQAVEALRAYVNSGKADDGDKARQAVNQQRQLSATEAAEAYELLISSANREDGLARRDELVGLLIQRHTEGRKLAASKLALNPLEVFQQLYHSGDEGFKALIPVVLDASIWPSNGKSRVAAIQDVFRLSIATLIEAGLERPERAMRAVTHLLAVQPESVVDLLDEGVVDIVLCDLDIRLDAGLRRQAMLASSKMLEAMGEKGDQFFVSSVKGKVAKQDYDDLIIAFSAAAAIFPILPAVAAKLFMTESFVEQLVPNLEKNSDDGLHGRRKSRTLEQAALELLSAACVDKACRDAINKHCAHWLLGLSEEREGIHKALATLILAKISGESVEDVTSKLTQLVVDGDAESEQAIEGLAYTSLQPKVKEEIANNDKLLRSLVKALSERPAALFGCLTIFANLTAYRPSVSDEQKKMSQLKAYANQSKLPPPDPLDNDKHVTARCKKLLDHDSVAALVACRTDKQQPIVSLTNITLVVRILLAMAKEQKHRAKMAQQGTVKLLIQIRDRTAKTNGQPATEACFIAYHAAHSLARLLISVNPAHVFSHAVPASSAVSALIPLLSPDGTAEAGNEPRDLLPTFEALLGLTNLASMDEPTARDMLLRKTTFDHIENLLFSSNTLVQRASVELVCNLMAAPTCVAKFADGSKDSERRLRILFALTDVEDLATRRAAGGALAALTEWDVAVTAVLDAEKGVKTVLSMCADESEEVVHRGLVCLSNAVDAPGPVGQRATEIVKKEADGITSVEERLKTTKNGDLLALGRDIIGKLD